MRNNERRKKKNSEKSKQNLRRSIVRNNVDERGFTEGTVMDDGAEIVAEQRLR